MVNILHSIYSSSSGLLGDLYMEQLTGAFCRHLIITPDFVGLIDLAIALLHRQPRNNSLSPSLMIPEKFCTLFLSWDSLTLLLQRNEAGMFT